MYQNSKHDLGQNLGQIKCLLKCLPEAQLRPLQVDELVGVEVELPQVDLVGEGAVLDLLDLVDVEADEGGRVGDGGGRHPTDLVVGEVERLDDQLRAEVVEVANLGDPVGAQVEPSEKEGVFFIVMVDVKRGVCL